MAIELLDLKKNWGKIKGAFGMGPLFKRPAGQPQHTFVNGVNPTASAAQGIAGSPKGSVFGGKTFSNR